MIKTGTFLTIATLTLGACASKEQATTKHVSPLRYIGLTCEQMNDNALHSNSVLAGISEEKTSKALGNGAAVVASVFFPPAAFLMTDMDNSAEVEELRSDAIALQSAAQTNNCSLVELDVLTDE